MNNVLQDDKLQATNLENVMAKLSLQDTKSREQASVATNLNTLAEVSISGILMVSDTLIMSLDRSRRFLTC